MGRTGTAVDDVGYRDAQADLMRAKRQSARIVVVPKCQDRERRELLESDDIEWLLWYFATESGCESPFTYKFTGQQTEMIAAIRAAIMHGGDQAIAASRGEGKTTIAERLTLKYTLQGSLKFTVLFAATGSAAEDSLDAIKCDLENNERLLADYPEVCVPVAALENTPNRAHYQLVSGDRHDTGSPYEAAQSKFTWCGPEVVMPKVPGSPSAGAIIATRGLDSAVRGVKKKGKRVDLALIDDPDTEETARSEDQSKKLEDRIDKAIAGLGSQRRRVSRVMLTTLQSRISASYRFTDAEAKPSWKGKRFRFLLSKPDRLDLWEEYTQLLQQDWRNAKAGAPTNLAMELYAVNRAEMDRGAVVANPNRFTPSELSALQFYYNEIARTSADAVSTEYDNDPPEEAGPIESGITSYRVQRQVSGYPRREVPPGCTELTRGVDCKKTGLHWVVRAWRPDGTGFVIDYGFKDTHGTVKGREGEEDQAAKAANDVAIRRAILELVEEGKAVEYKNADGEQFDIKLTLIDSRYRMNAVFSSCLEAGLGVYPVLGFGKSAGCWRPTFTAYNRHTAAEKPGDNWNMKREGKVWVVHANADHWKAWEHDRWMTDPTLPGCLKLFGIGSHERRLSFDEQGHHAYSRHIVAEVEVEEMVKGVLKRYWKPKPGHGQNHYLDASYYSDVAANILGVRLEMAQSAKPVSRLPTNAPRLAPNQRPPARILAKESRR